MLVPLDLLPHKGQFFSFLIKIKRLQGVEFGNWTSDKYMVSPVCDLSTSTTDYIDVSLSVAKARR